MNLLTLKTVGEIIAEIRMSRQSFNGSFLIIEGEDDSKFWKSRIARDECQIVIAGGKEKAKESVIKFDAIPIKGILGIVDDDFDSLLGVTIQSSNILITDTHDLETLLLRSQALEKVLAEYTDSIAIENFEKTENLSVRQALLDRSVIFGKLRWLSCLNNWNISFNDLSPWKYFDREKWYIDIEKLYQDYCQQTPGIDVDLLRYKIDNLPLVDPWKVVQGHDCLDILSIGFVKALGGKPPLSPKELNNRLRLAFEYISTQSYIFVHNA